MNQAEVATNLANTLQDTARRNAATEWLKSRETVPGFLVCLLQLTSDNALPLDVRLAAAIYFKNRIMTAWVPDTDADKIPEADQTTVKGYIVTLMLTTPRQLQAQLSQALAIISSADFPLKWKELLPELVSKMGGGDYAVIVGVLETASSIFHRYRYEAKQQALWEEIVFVLGIFQQPLTTIFQQTCGLIQQAQGNVQALKSYFSALLLCCEIYLSLTSQELPDYFLEHLKEWMAPFIFFMKYKNPALDPTDPEVPGPVEEVQAVICEIINLFANKYDEDFKEWVQPFVSESWTLLTQLSEQPRYDTLATTAIKFLTSVVKKPWHKDIFNNEAALKTICEKVVIPQLKLRESDVELFHSNGLEYVRRDMEGSDLDTRRRTTVDFVQGLCHFFEQHITNILKEYVGVLLKEYSVDKARKWIAKDAAMYIILALAIKGQTRSAGTTITNPYVDLLTFMQTEVIPELQSPNVDDLPILKADCLKFVSTFRTKLPPDAFPVILPLLINHLASTEFVIHTYAAAAIERLLNVRDGPNLRYGKAQIQPYLEKLLLGLFGALDHEESKENAYVMKSIMRVCAVAEETIAAFASAVINKAVAALASVASNPKNPQFNHYLFETLACLVMNLCKANPASVGAFEGAFFPPFQTMLGMETCQEFGPYVFQILAQLLEIRPDVSDPYIKIFPSLLNCTLWDNQGNVPAIIRLLKAYLAKGAQTVVVGDRLVGLLGIFQKLNASRKMDHYGFELLTAVIEYIPMQTFQPYMLEMLKVIFSRLQPERRTDKYVRCLVVFLSYFICKYDLNALLKSMDQLQPKIFSMILEKIWVPAMEHVTDDDKKVVVVGMTKMLCQSPDFLDPAYLRFWPPLVGSVVKLLESKGAGGGDEEDSLDQSDKGFSTAMAKLAYAPCPEHDLVPSVKDPREHFVTSLKQLVVQHPGKFNDGLAQLPPAHQKYLSQYF